MFCRNSIIFSWVSGSVGQISDHDEALGKSQIPKIHPKFEIHTQHLIQDMKHSLDYLAKKSRTTL